MKSRLLAFFAVSLFLFVLCSPKNDPIVAKIGNKKTITLSQFQESFSRRKSIEAIQNATLEEKESHLNRMIDEMLLIVKAYDLKLDQDSTVLKNIERVREKYVIDALYNQEVIEKLIKESDLEEYYKNLGKEVVVRNIFLKCPMDASDETVRQVEDKATIALERIKKGEPFPRVARDVSEDDKTTMDGGLMKRPLVWKGTDDPFLKTAFELKQNEVSNVFRTEKGFNIIKVDEIHAKELRPYDKLRRVLKEEIKNAKKEEITEKAKTYLEELMKENQLSYNEDVLEQLAESMKPVNDDLALEVKEYVTTLPDTLRDKVMVHYDGGEMKVKDIENWILPSEAVMKLGEVWAIKYGVERQLSGKFLTREAERLKVDQQDEVQDLIRSSLEGEMVKQMMSREIHDKITLSDADLKAFYEANKETRYVSPGRVKIQEVMVKDKAMAEQIKKWIQGGRDMGDLAQEYTIRPGFKKRKGISNYFPQSLWGAVGKAAFELKKGDLAGPIYEEGKGYSVIRLLDKKESEISPYHRVSPQVRQDCFFEERAKRKSAFLDTLRQEYQIEKFVDVL